MVVGPHYSVGKKYCRCECYFVTERLFCECCGMQLRASPANREYKEKVRAKRKLIPFRLVNTNGILACVDLVFYIRIYYNTAFITFHISVLCHFRL